MPKCKICNREFPNWVKIRGEFKNLGNRKYCLECSPYKMHNTRKLHKVVKSKSECNICHNVRKINRKGYCSSCAVKMKRIRNKIAAIKYKGAKCSKCGKRYSHFRQTASFEFHHNGSSKDFQISTKLDRKSWANITSELDKCDLVCSNCHREAHFDLSSNYEFVRKIFDYDGDLDIWVRKGKGIRPFIR